MKILQVSPLVFPTRKDICYGGTERAVLYLDKEISKRRDHQSVVAASRGSDVYGELLEGPDGIWEYKYGVRQVDPSDDIVRRKHEEYFRMIVDYANQNGVDVIHHHPGKDFFASEALDSLDSRIPILLTIHASTRKGEGLQREFIDMCESASATRAGRRIVSVNAISEFQKGLIEPHIPLDKVVYHGIDPEVFGFKAEKEDYLFSLGRIHPQKGQDLAIRAAKATGHNLIMGGEVHSLHEDYWKQEVEPFIDGEQVKFIGPVNDEQKIPYYQNAKAFLMPIRWGEAFGLVMIEAMATGTPVIALRSGAVPEVVEHGKTGFVVDSLEEMVEAIGRIDEIDPHACRKRVIELFTGEIEADNYLRLYEQMVERAA